MICTGFNGSEFRGVSAGQHIIKVEEIDGAEPVMVNVPDRVVSFAGLQGM